MFCFFFLLSQSKFCLWNPRYDVRLTELENEGDVILGKLLSTKSYFSELSNINSFFQANIAFGDTVCKVFLRVGRRRSSGKDKGMRSG